MRYRLAIFDFDGTLVDSLSWFMDAFNSLADEFKFRPVAPREREQLRGLTSQEILKHMGVAMWRLPAIAVRMRQLAARDIHKFHLFPGVPEMLGALRAQNITIAIVSSNGEENIRNVLGPESSQLINHYLCGASLFGKRQKLHSTIKVARLPAAQAIYIGDELRDATAAQGAGIAFGAVGWGYARPAALAATKPAAYFKFVPDISRYLVGSRGDARRLNEI